MAGISPGSGTPHGEVPPPTGTQRSGRRVLPLLGLVLLAGGLLLPACGLHVSRHGVSGTVFGHRFSAASGQLPAGFPPAVPVPDASRVLAGGGADNRWDVAFAVTGSTAEGTAAYQAKFQAAGYTLSNLRSGSLPTSGAPSGSAPTGGTPAGSIFTARDAQWTVEVATGTASSARTGALKAGEFATNITVVPTASAQG